MTFHEKFNELKGKYGETADFSKVDSNIAAEITLTDPDCGGKFYVTHIDGKTDIQPYDYKDNTVSIRLESSLLEELLQGEKSPVTEFLCGHIDAEGSSEHALTLINALKAKKKPGRRKKTVEL